MEDNKESRPLSLLERAIPSILPAKDVPKNFWKLTSDDISIFIYQLAVILFVWAFSLAGGSLFSVSAYWDGPNYIYAAKTLYNIPDDYPWSRSFGYKPFYFACHLPGYPLVIRFFSYFTFGSYFFAGLLSIIFCSLLVCYVFRRLLIVYNAVSDPKWTVTLSIFIPARFFLYKCVGASEPLFMSYTYLALIFYKTQQLFPMLLSMWGACITRIEGLGVVGTIGLCYLIRGDIIRAAFTSLGFASFGGVLLLHQYRFHDYLAYIHFNQGHQGLIRFPPFFSILEYGGDANSIYSFLILLVPLVVGTFSLYSTAFPLAIFSTVYIVYVSMLFHLDIYRYALPGYVPALLIGMDSILSNNQFKTSGYMYCILFLGILAMYSMGQINSNRCSDEFLFEILGWKSDKERSGER